MNVLKEVAHWKQHTELPDEAGVYLTFTSKQGLHQWGFDLEKQVWGDGVHVPGASFKWLNVRIDILSGIKLDC